MGEQQDSSKAYGVRVLLQLSLENIINHGGAGKKDKRGEKGF